MTIKNQHEPPPIKNSFPAVWDLVKEDIIDRDKKGKEKYGTRLQPFNGRKPLIDAYQEALDLVVYLRQAIYEQDYNEIKKTAEIHCGHCGAKIEGGCFKDTETCKWVHDGVESTEWISSCGNETTILYSISPIDAGYEFCQNCGKKVVV